MFVRRVHAVLLSALVALSGCQAARLVSNQPLSHEGNTVPQYTPGYALRDMLGDQPGETLVILAFSGGGKRSAAFGHGVLRGLRDIAVTDQGRTRTLLDDVVYISAVSGGSFPAMHYGLYRERSFQTFEHDFLKRDINAYIWGTFLLPWNWEWIANPLYGTNDRMSEVYDRLMFHGATYADLARNGLPLISVNATDIANGVSFAFIQPTFDLLCSDLLKFPLSRAVAASNGFPVLFTPITLTSYRKQCGGARPPYAPPANWADNSEEISRRGELAQLADRYLDANRTRYVHLMDGGIADNLALRGMLNGLIALDSQDASFQRAALRTRRVLVISGDGQAPTDPTLGQQRIVTGLGQIFGAVSGTQIDAYNFETLLLADAQTRSLVERIRTARCAHGAQIDGHACGDVQGALVHLSLANIADPATRTRLQGIATGLTIPDRDVDALVEWGERLTRDNATIRSLVSNLDSPSGPETPASADGF